MATKGTDLLMIVYLLLVGTSRVTDVMNTTQMHLEQMMMDQELLL
jgi:hypothetical protein